MLLAVMVVLRSIGVRGLQWSSPVKDSKHKSPERIICEGEKTKISGSGPGESGVPNIPDEKIHSSIQTVRVFASP